MTEMHPHAENRRLYELDKSAVGKDQAIKRWQIKDVDGKWVDKLLCAPIWTPNQEYRRNPEAPPLPSLDWHEAPDWANWRLIRPCAEQWWEYKPLDVCGPSEPRPNPDWFELTRPDYEASKKHGMSEYPILKDCPYIDRAERYSGKSEAEHRREEQHMTDEYLTSAELMYAIGDAMAAGETPKVFETEFEGDGTWETHQNWHEIIYESERGCRVRRKPRIRHLIDHNGNRHEWPEPFTSAPPDGTPYYVPLIGSSGYVVERKIWGSRPEDWGYLEIGFAHKTWSAVEQMARALLMASGWDGQRND